MKRRDLLKAAIAIPFLPAVLSGSLASAFAAGIPSGTFRPRVRPGQSGWPQDAQWEELSRDVGGRLIKPVSPFAGGASSAATAEALRHLDNPYYIGDEPALTQTSGWADAWTSQPSAYAVVAHHSADVVAAVNFAREHHLRLVVKGGGHSYQGTSNAPDSLLVWTRHMNDVTLHNAFVAQGCEGSHAPQPAVTMGAGAMWIDAYDAVTTRGGRYVQGGGCTTVGVAGLVQSGGFGSFSKNFGIAAAGLLEAEIVTADGVVRIANARTNPELFWGIKGGGGGSLGVVTRLTLRTHELPEKFGAAFGAIKALSDEAYRELIARAMAFYQDKLFNRHWGEQWIFQSDNVLRIAMVFQGIDQAQAQAIWKPFLDWVRSSSEYSIAKEVKILDLPAEHFWDADFYRKYAPSAIVEDDRPGAPRDHIVWSGDHGQAGWFLHAYGSAWMPATLLEKHAQPRLVDAIFAATRQWELALHFNKGLAGAPESALDASRDTAMNPDVLGAFALAMCGADGAPAFAGMPGPGANLPKARGEATGVTRAMEQLLKVAPNAGSYVSESNYFEPAWQRSFWGPNYPRLAAVKRKYDPSGLFFVHHGVGSEAWSADGFTPQR
ncbi:FAD-dependent oxidoreductase [Rhodanobacter sp. L36]|uniref:FAD-dependent oxidoreductase n=1 Tax=Rhodanobacter sp. L36 TaxID=1747221 RepID=UPI00131CDBA1|nr:FAD-dependent oxidoreductase [Rhodanobacter sp. L36]